MADAPGVAARRAALRAVRAVHAAGAWGSPAVDRALRAARLDERDRAFAANLAFETLRWQGTLDWALAQVVTRPLPDVEPAVLDVLRLGAWQLLYGRMPDRAAVAATVEMAKAEVGPRVAGFVNGVLRALARHRDTLPWPGADTSEGLALATGYPRWVVAEARARFGERARAVLEAGNVPPGLTLRAVGDRDALLAELRGAGPGGSQGGHSPPLGLDAEPGLHAPEAVRVPGVHPGTLAAVAEGRATPQDEASMLVARVLAAGWQQDRPLVLDVCAGPGGKATHLAALGARVVAADVRPARARMVAELAARLRVPLPVLVAVADGTRPPWRPATFDAVLVDAPCTGLGVVRRRPELRWRRSAEDVPRLAALQRALLAAAAPLVRPGGIMVYSACTWTVAETAAVAGAFLDDHPGFIAETPDRGHALAGDPGVQFDPARDGTDGMYIARLVRKF